MSNNYNVVEMYLKVYLTKNIKKENERNEISKLIDKCFLKDKEYSDFHEKNLYKFYSFNSFYPLEDKKLYKAGKIYTIIIRTVDQNLANFFENNLVNEYIDSIKVLSIEKKIIAKKHINKVFSITPIVIKCENGYWKNKISLPEYEDRLKINLIKKYNKFNNVKMDEDFELFTFLKFENKKPIATDFKEKKLLGDKLTLNVSENEKAQDLVYFALGTGLGELNARGFGFMNFRWL
jgi:CRISPR-associated endoribonuclease Cas6